MVSQPQLIVCHLILLRNEKLSFAIHCKVILSLQGKQRKKKCLESGSHLNWLGNRRNKIDESCYQTCYFYHFKYV